MSSLRRRSAVLAAGLLVAFPGGALAAEADLVERAAQREALSASGALSASAGTRRLPLPAPLARPAAAARTEARLARTRAPAELLVGVTRHRHMASVAADLERLGSQVKRVDYIGVIGVDAHSAAEVVARLGDDPRVAYIERNRMLEPMAEPADRIDPETGIKFGWAFDTVRAGGALAAVGGGSQRRIAVIDSGVDVGHPDLAGRITRGFNSTDGTRNVSDQNGHGTFVTGLIAMVDGNEIGGKGVAGNTQIDAVKASDSQGRFSVLALVLGIDAAVRSDSDILNMSLGGESFGATEARALDDAFIEDVLPVAAAGNEADEGNPIAFPAAAIGGNEGRPGIGLAVGATKPDDTHAEFSNHHFYVSVSAPGSGQSGLCPHGVFSTIPRNQAVIWDDPRSCNQIFGSSTSDGRWAYGPGTSFAAPIAAGIAALTWQAEPRLQSQQVAEVVMRSARQTRGEPGTWNEFTGRGIVNGEAAVTLAGIYDVVAPRGLRVRQRRRGRNRLVVTARGADDATDEGDELAGDVRHSIFLSKNGRAPRLKRSGARSARYRLRLRRGARYRFYGVACDANGNCDSRRLSQVRGR